MSAAVSASFEEARAALRGVLDGRMDANHLSTVGDGFEQLAGFAAALQDRCERAAVGDDRPVVCCAGELEP
ncbi:MAG: hypothetical protein JWN32_1885, partial [Solirubrobacterales bacterium]|nr:hypothetical protein [Solirubrobacterales bacterium]